MELKILTLAFFLTFALASSKKLDLDPKFAQQLLHDYTQQQLPVRPNAERVFVELQNGTLEGTTYVALGGDTVYAYLGIPFAEAPIDDLRFQPPVPYNQKYPEDPRPAYLHPPACPQFLYSIIPGGNEDCLFVSVYTKRAPNDTTSEPLPVMYFIHGGGYLLGQSNVYTGSKLLQNDVVLVTVQYRLGPLGFLSTMDDLVPGNMGMKDQVMGLRWIQDNIAAFGGDPTKVTVFGESAGGASATFMLLSPLSRGLFSAAASMSGTALAEWSMDREPLKNTWKLVKHLNCTGIPDEIPSGPNDAFSQAVFNCLKPLDAQAIMLAHFELLLLSQSSEMKALLGGTSPIVEPPHAGAFLAQEPLEILEHGEIMDVPVMMGANQHEGSFLLGAAYALKLGWNGTLDDEVYVHDKLLGDLLATWGVSEATNGASISQIFASSYVPADNPRTNFTSMQYELIDLFSALFMKAPILRTAEILSRRNSNPVYLYSFEYVSKAGSLWNFVDILAALLPEIGLPELELLVPPFDGGITHADDLMYMFSFPMLPIPNQKDRDMFTTFCTFYTEFATNHKPRDDWERLVWPAKTYMEIKSTPTLKSHYPSSWQQGLTHPEE